MTTTQLSGTTGTERAPHESVICVFPEYDECSGAGIRFLVFLWNDGTALDLSHLMVTEIKCVRLEASERQLEISS